MLTTIQGTQNEISEWGFHSQHSYTDPFNEITVDLLVSGPAGQAWRVPAYWAGGSEWRVRFAPPQPGTYTFQTECSDPSNADLHQQQGRLEVKALPGHKSPAQRRPAARRGQPAHAGARRRHALLLAGRYLVDGAVQPLELAGGFPNPGSGPQRQGVLGGADRRRAVPGYAGI